MSRYYVRLGDEYLLGCHGDTYRWVASKADASPFTKVRATRTASVVHPLAVIEPGPRKTG